MYSIKFNELFEVVSNLSDSKDSLGYASGAFEFLFKGVLTNTHPIVLIETACKILFKILSDRISLACSTFDVLCKNNFLVLKAYNSVDWKHFEKSLSTTQHILNVAGEFFQINNISINNNKTMAISINSRYLGIFLSTKDFLKPSLAKTNSDVHFFTNLVLKKTILDKQLLYLVLVVFYSIVSYRMQFSFISVSVCNNDTIHHPFFYGLKSFLQVQFESKVASFVSFVNSGGVLDHLFFYRSHDLQFHDGIFMSAVLDKSRFLKFLSSLHQYSVAFVNQLCNSYNFHDPVPEWFKISAIFFNSVASSSACSLVLSGVGFLNIFNSSNFVSVCNHFSQVGSSSLSVYTDKSLKDLGTVGCKAGAATFFKNIDLDLGIGILGLMLSTMVELQAIVLVLKCVFLSSSVYLFSDNQFALDACKLKLGLIWHKVKDHSGVLENKHANVIAGAASLSGWRFSSRLDKHFIVADGSVVSGNSRHFVCNVYCLVCHAHWEVDSNSKFLTSNLLFEVNWLHLLLV
ncbi:hypothetical protein G9A89_005576 [Geosiphon pyriformis]|nr:hypothetical protein G9A89_005576 [Geosiphon pyriformis]